MNPSRSLRRALLPLMALALAMSLTLPASAFFWNSKKEADAPRDFSKNGMVGSVISFTPEEFGAEEKSADPLAQITLDVLPDTGAGVLCMGSEPLSAGSAVDVSRPERTMLPVCRDPHPLHHKLPLHPHLRLRAPGGAGDGHPVPAR